jgi:cation diffusion facilitator family transporter
MTEIRQGPRVIVLGALLNLGLATLKIVTGILGNSYALVADGIESTADIISSVIVWSGLRYAEVPPDDTHPYGHGKAESLAALVASSALVLAAIYIGVESVHGIQESHHAPAWFTLVVLVVVIATKEIMFRVSNKVGGETGSTAVRADAWHHRSDALTSAAAFIGISIALIGGEGYETADAWAALAACFVIGWNGIHLALPALNEIMDGAVDRDLQDRIRALAAATPEVKGVEKCRVRKSGTGLLMDIHIEVDGSMSVTHSHEVGHEVKNRLLAGGMNIRDVTVHIEPAPPADNPSSFRERFL